MSQKDSLAGATRGVQASGAKEKFSILGFREEAEEGEGEGPMPCS